MKYIILAISALLVSSCSSEPKAPEQPVKIEKTPAQIQAEIDKKKAEELKRKNEEMIKKANEDLGYIEPTHVEPEPITADKIELLTSCQMKVKARLKDPQSFKMKWGDYRYVVSDYDLRINFPYTAKNSFNATTPGRAICIFTRGGAFISAEIR